MYHRSLLLVVFNCHEYTVAKSQMDTKLEAMQSKLFKSLDETSGKAIDNSLEVQVPKIFDDIMSKK